MANATTVIYISLKKKLKKKKQTKTGPEKKEKVL